MSTNDEYNTLQLVLAGYKAPGVRLRRLYPVAQAQPLIEQASRQIVDYEERSAHRPAYGANNQSRH
jgi:hypothetical protein